MKYISKTLLTLSSILICQIVFADCPNQIKEDANTHVCITTNGQTKHIIAGVDTFSLSTGHSDGSTVYDYVFNMTHIKKENWKMPIANAWTSGNMLPIPLNVPFVQIPGSASTNVYTPAQIIGIFDLFGLINTNTSQNNIGDVYALQIWGTNPEGQRVLMGEKKINAAADMYCNSFPQVTQVCAIKSDGMTSDLSIPFTIQLLTKHPGVSPDFGTFDATQHIGYQKFFIETYTSTPMLNISAEIIPLNNGDDHGGQINVYSIELNINT